MSDLSRIEARRIAEEHLRHLYEGRGEVMLMDELTREEPFGWVFFYQSKAYVERGDQHEALIGNAPFVVDRTGRLHETGTSLPLEEYLRHFREGGMGG